MVSRLQLRGDATRFDRELEVVVGPAPGPLRLLVRVLPALSGSGAGRHGTFDDCIERLADVKRMGFDVVYLPPIHPIGLTGRKGRDNALTAEPGDPGSPWAIGGPEEATRPCTPPSVRSKTSGAS